MRIPEENIHAALTLLAERFPQTFVLEKYRPHRPLKVGIAVDIIERCPELEWRVLKVALAAYARLVMYLKGMIPGTARVDLDGNACGEVSARDAEYAVEFLALREARRAAAVAAKGAERVAKQMAVTAAPPPPPAAKTLKERPVLRLPAQKCGLIPDCASETAPGGADIRGPYACLPQPH
jgi:ProP effector